MVAKPPRADARTHAGVSQGDIWWADLAEPIGSAPGYRRPVVILQGDALNHSTLSTVVCVVLTSNLQWGKAPGNVLLSAKATGLSKDSVANVSQLITVDRAQLTDWVGVLPPRTVKLILTGVDVVLGR